MGNDWSEIVDLGEGIFEVKYHRLTLQSLRSRRTRLANEVFDLRQKIGNAREEIEHWKEQIKQKEAMLNALTEDKIRSFMWREQKRRETITKKANAFLESYIGKVAFEKLQKQGSFEFIGLDGAQYRIKRNAMLQRAQGNYWYNLCVIKPVNLPLPDVVASIFTAATQSPEFLGQTVSTKTEEEVKT